jgi:PAS domain S-box-containing protein
VTRPVSGIELEHLADLLPEPMLVVSRDGTILWANGALARVAGTPKQELLGRRLPEVGWEGDGDIGAYLTRCARTREFVFGSASLRAADGTLSRWRCEGARWSPRGSDTPRVFLRLVPREHSTSRFVALTQKVEELRAEVHRRKRAEDEAWEQRELLRVTLSSIGDAVIATDLSGKVTFMNEVAERLTGWTLAEAAGHVLADIFKIVNEDTRQALENPAAHVLKSGTIVGLANHTLLIARDGTERPIDDSGAPIIDADGRMHGVVLVFRDVTDLRAAERAQTAARRAAEASNRAKDEFLAMLSHELRTPLNAILGWTRLLRHGALNPSQQAHGLQVIERNAEIQARLVEDLLDVSRIAAGRLRLQSGPVDLAPVISAAVEAVRPAAANKGLTLAVHTDRTAMVRGDAARLQQVIWNLLTNAVKFTPPGGRVSVEASEDRGRVRIVVRDTGEGFPPEFKPYLFDAFSQADSSFSRPHGGLGLGLTIVRRLVEAHGGTVDGDSPGSNQGATFTVDLPASADERVEPAEKVEQLPSRLRGRLIVVVDDDIDSCELTRMLLEDAGAEVRTCFNARDALNLLRRERCDLLLADLSMPGDDGFWLIHQIRFGQAADGIERNVPAIAVTAFTGLQDRQAALAAGYDDHVPKPISADTLLTSVARVIGRADAISS